MLRQNFSKEAVSDKRFDLVCDIDAVLVADSLTKYHPSRTVLMQETVISRSLPHLHRQLFIENKMIIEMNEEGKERSLIHCLLPGVVEFFQYILMYFPQCRLSFFSHGKKIRNKTFVDQLMDKVQAGIDFKINKKEIRVFSREDCLFPHQMEGSEWAAKQPRAQTNCAIPLDHNGYWQGSYKKCLKKIFPEQLLDNVILIDDQMHPICGGEENNLLRVQACQDFRLGELLRLSRLNHEPGTANQMFIKNGVNGFKASNHMFFILGVLLETLECTSRKNLSLVQALSACQIDPETGHYRYAENEYKHQYYERGLKALQEKINPKLSFLVPFPELYLPTDLHSLGFLPGLALARQSQLSRERQLQRQEGESPARPGSPQGQRSSCSSCTIS